MAEKQTEFMSNREEQQRRSEEERQQSGQRRQQWSRGQANQSSRLARRDQTLLLSPFELLQRLADGVSGVFDDFAFGRTGSSSSPTSGTAIWAPDVDVFHRGNELVIRADLPGLKRDDVAVEISDEAVTISGERSQEREDERGGFYRIERSYGSFYRVIPLPEGAIGDQAKAAFNNGVLEITMPAPPEQVSRGRRLEISEGIETKKANSKEAR
jgi:HSP20 family protein